MNNKMNHPLITVDGRTLMDRPLEPPNFVVDTLISQGLHILAGSPKVGKSWLALWLAVTVAKGEPVWNMSTKQGTTLYLCLEDSVLRIQNRLFEITNSGGFELMKIYKTISQIEDKSGNVIKLRNFTDCKKQKIYKVEHIEYNKAPYVVLVDDDGLVLTLNELKKLVNNSRELIEDINKEND